MLLSSDDVLRWIEDVRDSQKRLMQRSARRADANSALMAVGGQDALEELEVRVKSYINRETYESFRAAERSAKKVRTIHKESA